MLLQTENVNIAQSEFHEYDSMAPAESTKAAAAPTGAACSRGYKNDYVRIVLITPWPVLSLLPNCRYSKSRIPNRKALTLPPRAASFLACRCPLVLAVGAQLAFLKTAMADRDAIDRAFHGYEPLRIVDDVINSFNDCALRRGSPVSLRPVRQRPALPCADSCDAADAMQKVLTQAPGMGEHSKAIEEVSPLSHCRTPPSAPPPTSLLPALCRVSTGGS